MPVFLYIGVQKKITMQLPFGGIPISPVLSCFLSAFLAGLIAYLAIPVVVRIARAKGLVDKPNHRTSHNGSVPLLGGVAVFSGIMIGGSIFLPHMDFSSYRYILPALIIMFFIGQKDDLEHVSAGTKLMAQLISAFLIVVLADVRIGSLHGFAGIHSIPDWASVTISMILFLIIVNAFNLIDGIDGLASGMGILVAGILALWLYGSGYYGYAVTASALVGSLIPFFFFNVFSKKNKLFLGDTGSLLVGLLVSVFVLKICSVELPEEHFLHMNALPSVAIGVLIYPLFDLLRVFFLRLIRGRSPFKADRNHIHHLFLDAGYSHRRSTFYILSINIVAIVYSWFMRDSSILLLGLTLLAGSIAITGLLYRNVVRRLAKKAK